MKYSKSVIPDQYSAREVMLKQGNILSVTGNWEKSVLNKFNPLQLKSKTRTFGVAGQGSPHSIIIFKCNGYIVSSLREVGIICSHPFKGLNTQCIGIIMFTPTPMQTQNPTPAPAQSTEYLNLKVKSNQGQEIYFKIKKSTAFKKLMDTYCQRSNLNVNTVRFLFYGQRISDTQTPKDLNMENNDEIDVVVEQFGG